jgi:hypothetical protein
MTAHDGKSYMDLRLSKSIATTAEIRRELLELAER